MGIVVVGRRDAVKYLPPLGNYSLTKVMGYVIDYSLGNGARYQHRQPANQHCAQPSLLVFFFFYVYSAD